MRLIFFAVLLTALVFSAAVTGQETEADKPSQITIPENIKQEIVRRIILFNFKPAKRQKVVYLKKDDIAASWLPKIPNVEFRLLSDEEIEDSEASVYFFTAPEVENNIYSIGFAYGDPGCDYHGKGWNFRITNDKLRLWQSGGIGGGCGFGPGSRNFQVPGKLNAYPNELDGYKFFDQGKLKGIKLTVSTKEDIAGNFGSECETYCDYNEDWQINFSYFGSLTKEITTGDKTVKYVPKPEYIGKIYEIHLIPKRRVSFSRMTFSAKFNSLGGYAIGHNYDTEGRMIAAAGTAYQSYEDRYGLRYSIFEKTGYTVGEVEKGARLKGDLVSIEYGIPKKIEETLFIEQP